MRGQGWRCRLRSVLCAPLAWVLVLSAPVAAEASISPGDVRVAEGDGGVTATFTLTRSAPLLAGPTTVAFATVDATAHAPADFQATSGRITFPGALLGATQAQQVAVAIAGDRLDEPNESFRLVISGAEVADGAAIGTIVDDDPQPTVAVGDAAPASEGGTASFVIGLSAPSGRDTAVSYATADAGAIAGQDYTARAGRLTIPAGSASATVSVALIDDAADEPSEGFELRLAGPAAAALGRAAASATILDNDETAAPASGGGRQPARPPTGGFSPPPASALARLGLGSPRLRPPGTALVTVSCPPDAVGCRGRVTLFSRARKRSKIKALRRERRLGRAPFALDGGTTATLEIALTRADRRLLDRVGRLLVRAFAVTEDAAGRTGVRSVSGTLVRRTAHSSPSRR